MSNVELAPAADRPVFLPSRDAGAWTTLASQPAPGLVRDDEVLLSLNEASAFLRTSRSTMYRLMADGRLCGHKIGRKWVFYKNDLKALLTSPRGATG
ncbi:MAG: helix-turn-helix domain-containing protein [Chloroflexi bacterium]|nr:helix-turn-helix domain-containing protein [Chloroflexota bacterium]